MDRDPASSARGIQQGIQDRPIRDRIGSVLHCLSLAEGRRYRSRIEVVPSDRNRRVEIAFSHQVVTRYSHFGTITLSEPANPRRQPLKLKLLLRQPEPATQRLILGKKAQSKIIGFSNIFRIAGQRDPPKRAFPLTKQRANVFRYKSWNFKGILYSRVKSAFPDIVAIVKCDGPVALQPEHCLNMNGHRPARPFEIFCWPSFP